MIKSFRKNSNKQGIRKERPDYTGTGYPSIRWTVQSFDDQGRLVQQTYSNGTQTQASWDCCGKSYEKDAGGIEHYFTHDDLGRLVSDTKNNGASNPVTTYTYDAQGRTLDTWIEAGGLFQSVSNTYDTGGHLLQTIDQAGLVTSYDYQDGGRTITITLPGGATRITRHYLDGRIKSISCRHSHRTREIML